MDHRRRDGHRGGLHGPPAARPAVAGAPPALAMARGRAVGLAAAGLALLALALRLLDPLSSPVLPAEDPLIHLFRAERLAAKGRWPLDYPPGLPGLMVAMQAWGLPLHGVARWAPSFLGAASVLATFAVARRLGGPAAGLGAALLYAVVPEGIRRTTLWAPTALDLLLAPVLLWLLLDLRERRWAAAAPLAAVVLWLYVAHPWGLAYFALALAPVGLWWLARARMPRWWLRPAIMAALAAAAIPLALFLRKDALRLWDRAGDWAAQPSLAYAPPRFVEPVDMLGLPLMALVVLGLLRGPRAPRVLGAAWAAALLPLALLDLTGRDYVPYRTVAFLLPGLALLGGAGLAWLWPRALAAAERRAAPRRRALAAPALAVAVALLAALPAAAMVPWYRIHTPEEQAAFRDVAAPGVVVIAGSWPSAAQGAAWGADARIHPEFFRDAKARRFVEHSAEGPVLVVVDDEVRAKADPSDPRHERFDLAFLEGKPIVARAGRVAIHAWR